MRFLLFLLCLLLPTAATASTLSDAADNLSAGQSIKITTSGLDTLNSQDGSAGVTMWSNTAGWDSVNSQVHWIGKRDNAAYPHHWFIYTESTNTWTEGTLHPTLAGNQTGHGYDGTAVDSSTGDVYFRRYSSSTTVGGDGIMYQYDESAGTWSALTAISGRTSIADALEYWDGRGLIHSDQYGVRLWNGSSWSTLVSDGPLNLTNNYHQFGEYQPNADIYVFGGGNQRSTEIFRLESDNTLTTLGAAPFGLGNHESNQGILVADPSSTEFIAWDQANSWYSFDAVADSWTALSQCTGDGSTACTGTPNMTDEVSVAAPIPTHGVIMFFGDGDDVWLYKHSTATGGTNSGSVLQTVDIESATTNADTPFTIGLGFKKGDTTAPTVNLDNYQLEIKKTWNDGSVKHAIVSGRYDSTGGTPTTLSVYSAGSQPPGTDLTGADIVTAAPTATVAFSGQSWSTVSLASLLGSPDRTFISGPEMVEAHYSQDVAEQSDVVVKFYVRLYANDDVHIRVAVENGILDGADGVDYTYTPTVQVGGSTIYNTSITHENNTRWTVDGWVGVTDPDIDITHDTAYLEESGLVPNYWKNSPSATALNALTQTYTPMDNADWTAYFPDTGFQKQIGLLPNWDALYINSGGESRAFDSVIANALAMNSYPIVWRDPTTDMPIVLSDWSTWTVNGSGGSGTGARTAGSYTIDTAHHGSAGYLAYLITGDYYHLETLEYLAATLWAFIDNGYNGSGTSRRMSGQDRAVAWINRTIGQLAAIGPSDSIVDDFVALMAYQANYWNAERQTVGQNELGYLYSYQLSTNVYGVGKLAPWMQNFWVATYGYLSDLEPVADMTSLNAVRDHLYKIPVGLLGPVGTDNYCYIDAGVYTLKVAASTTDPENYYDSWGVVYSETNGSENTTCTGNVDWGYYETGYFANLFPAIAYAVEDGATGASNAWTRLTTASNWSDWETTGDWEDVPIWGIYPRSIGTPTGPTCSDGIQNGDETGVDCGGSCSPCSTPTTKRAAVGSGTSVVGSSRMVVQ